jgi:hypothetical protein
MVLVGDVKVKGGSQGMIEMVMVAGHSLNFDVICQ